ncbi:MAG TPA: histidine phosphatase family protein [Labilithrix sp.]|nr:histidine phosphatase family protein [Labilithrix sp.]
MGTRTLVLVRHGQYGLTDGGKLTELGREQAELTGRWICTHLAGRRVDALWSSTLPRARETATIIARNVPPAKVRVAGVLREGMYSKVNGYEVPPSERLEDRERADAAYARFFRTSRTDRLEIVVCHGNLIRYLVCRAIDVPVVRWTRMNSNHCSLTRILVRDTGAVRVVSYNETAHLPTPIVT